jgi:hypothetical protein
MVETRGRTFEQAEIERITGIAEKTPSSSRIETSASSGRIRIEAPASAPRPDLAGHRVVRPGYGEIYLVDPDGYRRRIPNYTTYSRLFRSWDGVTDLPCLADVAVRPELTMGTVLVRGDASPRIYLLDDGLMRLISGPPIMEKYWFHWEQVFVVKQTLIDRIPAGTDWE